MRHRHSVVWLDHYNAIVMHVRPDDADTIRLSSELEREDRQVHRKAGTIGTGHARDDVALYEQIAGELGGSDVIVITGPGVAKTAFTAHLEQRHPEVSRRVAAVEPLDHPTQGQLERYARNYIKRLQNLGAL